MTSTRPSAPCAWWATSGASSASTCRTRRLVNPMRRGTRHAARCPRRCKRRSDNCPSTSTARVATSICRSPRRAPCFQRRVWDELPPHPVRRNDLLRRTGPPHRQTDRLTRSGRGERQEPARHRRAVPPRDRCRRHAHRLRRRPVGQAGAPRPRTAPRRQGYAPAVLRWPTRGSPPRVYRWSLPYSSHDSCNDGGASSSSLCAS